MKRTEVTARLRHVLKVRRPSGDAGLSPIGTLVAINVSLAGTLLIGGLAVNHFSTTVLTLAGAGVLLVALLSLALPER